MLCSTIRSCGRSPWWDPVLGEDVVAAGAPGRRGIVKHLLAVACVVGAALLTLQIPATAAAPVPACRTTRHVICVGRADGGHNVAVTVGQTLKVDLGGAGFRWSGLQQVGPHLLRREGNVVARQGGITASYTAKTVGRTQLRASEAPACTTGQACPQFILLWQVRVVVKR
jgi:hypothetical protein